MSNDKSAACKRQREEHLPPTTGDEDASTQPTAAKKPANNSPLKTDSSLNSEMTGELETPPNNLLTLSAAALLSQHNENLKMPPSSTISPRYVLISSKNSKANTKTRTKLKKSPQRDSKTGALGLSVKDLATPCPKPGNNRLTTKRNTLTLPQKNMNKDVTKSAILLKNLASTKEKATLPTQQKNVATSSSQENSEGASASMKDASATSQKISELTELPICGNTTLRRSARRPSTPKKSIEINKKDETRTKKTFKCPKCSKHYSHKIYVQLHLQRDHRPGDQSNSTVSAKDHKFRCEFCSYETKYEEELKNHVEIHSYIKTPSSTTIKDSSKFDFLYFCLTCKMKFARKEQLIYHNAHACNHRIEVDLNSKTKHGFSVSAESSRTKVKGKEISELYSSDDILQKISQSDNIDDPVNSPQVNQQPDTNSLNKQMATKVSEVEIARKQTNERRAKCVRCDKNFKTHIELKKHLESLHKDELQGWDDSERESQVYHKCMGCDETFINIRMLTLHYFKDCAGKGLKKLHKSTPMIVIDTGKFITKDRDDSNNDTHNDTSNTDHEMSQENMATAAELLSSLCERLEKPSTSLNISSIAVAQVSDKSIKCIRCNLSFSSHTNLKLHLDQVHQSELSALSHIEKKKNNSLKVKFKCSKCLAASYNTVRELTKHYSLCRTVNTSAVQHKC